MMVDNDVIVLSDDDDIQIINDDVPPAKKNRKSSLIVGLNGIRCLSSSTGCKNDNTFSGNGNASKNCSSSSNGLHNIKAVVPPARTFILGSRLSLNVGFQPSQNVQAISPSYSRNSSTDSDGFNISELISGKSKTFRSITEPFSEFRSLMHQNESRMLNGHHQQHSTSSSRSPSSVSDTTQSSADLNEIEIVSLAVANDDADLIPQNLTDEDFSIKKNDRLLASQYDHPDSEWLPVDVITLDSNSGHAAIIYVTDNQRVRFVSGVYLASKPVKKWLPRGTKVVAREPISNKFYCGLIIQAAKSTNNRRYMVLFFNNRIGYAKPGETHLVRDQRCPPEQLISKSQIKFINFFSKEPHEYLTIKFRPGCRERIRIGNDWVNAEHVEADCLLMKFRTEHGQQIWLNRADFTQIESLFLAKQQSKEIATHLPNEQSPSQPSFNSTDYSTNQSNTFSSNFSNLPKMSVAKKSTSSAYVHSAEVGQSIQNQHPTGGLMAKLKKPMWKTHQLKYIDFNYYAQLPQRMQIRHLAHECDTVCILGEDLRRISLKKISPYQIPMLFGWKRDVVNCYSHTYNQPNFPKNLVRYTAPCGRRIYTEKCLNIFLAATRSQLEVDYFTFDVEIRIVYFDPALRISCFSYIMDISRNTEPVYISVVNELTSENLPLDYNYQAKRIPGRDVNIPYDPQFMICCSCQDDCLDPEKCECQQLTLETFYRQPSLIRDGDPPIYRQRRLESQKTITGIYECNKQCTCSKKCFNKVVQNGIRNRLQIFRTERKGWGIRTLNDIPKGAFVCDYSAVILNDKEANRVGKDGTDIYLANLDFIDSYEFHKEGYEKEYGDALLQLEMGENNDDSEEDNDRDYAPKDFTRKHLQTKNRDRPPELRPKGEKTVSASGIRVNPRRMRTFYSEDEPYTIDAQRQGNVGRFLNHSCSPNLFVQNVFVDTHDLRFPWIAFFASCYIPALTELTWSYGYKVNSVDGKQIKCECGAQNCQGRLL